jgi:hypothetical protein
LSTYWGYRCLSHDPPLDSERLSNHHADMLVATLRARPHVLKAIEVGHLHGGFITPEWWRFLVDHPRCEVVVVNEYGETLPVAFLSPKTPGMSDE